MELATQLEESTRRLDYSDYDRSKANELAIRNSIQWHLGNEYNDFANICLKEGKLIKNKDTTIAQWDHIFFGTNDDVNTIFFVQLNEFPHPKDIVYQSSVPKPIKLAIDFNQNIINSNEFFTEILPQDDSKGGNQFKSKTTLSKLCCPLHEFTSMQVPNCMQILSNDSSY